MPVIKRYGLKTSKYKLTQLAQSMSQLANTQVAILQSIQALTNALQGTKEKQESRGPGDPGPGPTRDNGDSLYR